MRERNASDDLDESILMINTFNMKQWTMNEENHLRKNIFSYIEQIGLTSSTSHLFDNIFHFSFGTTISA